VQFFLHGCMDERNSLESNTDTDTLDTPNISSRDLLIPLPLPWNVRCCGSCGRHVTTQRLKMVALSLLCALFCVVIILFLIPDSPAQRYLLDFMNWIGDVNPIYGTIILTVMYAFAMVFCFPGTPFNLAAGFLFGIWLGAAVTVVGCDLGATFAFLIGRTLGKEWAQEQVSKSKKFTLVSLAVEKNAWLIIFLVRLSPVLPFGLCNYLFGVTKVKFSSYWTATTAGLIPCTVAYTYLGSLMRNLTDIYSEDGGEGTSSTYLIAIAIVFTVLGITVITLVTKRTLDKTIQQQDLEMDKLCSRDPPVLEDESFNGHIV